jgi:diketogulonate reductase-like aldo/keto reductase
LPRIAENLAVWDFTLDETDMAQLRSLDRLNGNTQPLPDEMNATF